MKKVASRSALALVVSSLAAAAYIETVHAADGFRKVRCDAPIIPALIGVNSSASEPVVRIEARHKAIGLQHLGAEIVDDGPGMPISTINWRVCGRVVVVLDVRNVWQDAVELPGSSHEAPAFSTASCTVGGRKVEGSVVGVFVERPREGERVLPVRAGWRIDLKAGRFVPLDGPAICATDGIDSPNLSR